jgi:hypothetical protein
MTPESVHAQHMDEHPPLVGTWKMIAQKIVHPDRVEENLKIGDTPPGGNFQIKILTDPHFAFGRMSENGEEVTAGGGRYDIEGDTYTEVIEYHTSAPLVGTEIPFNWEIDEKGHWLHTGVIGSFTLFEIYELIDP